MHKPWLLIGSQMWYPKGEESNSSSVEPVSIAFLSTISQTGGKVLEIGDIVLDVLIPLEEDMTLQSEKRDVFEGLNRVS
jgi:hypothetical protein